MSNSDVPGVPPGSAPEVMGRSAARLRAEAMRFLRRFGLVSAAWSVLLTVAAPAIARPVLAWLAVGLHAAWAVVATRVRHDRAWWSGWFVVAVGLEVAAPVAGTGGWSLTGGAIVVVLVGVALSGRRSWVVATVAGLAGVVLARAALVADWAVANGMATSLVFAFGALGLTWLVRRLVAVVNERDRLQARLLVAETTAARATERAEAGARLHDTVLQHLAAVVHAGDLPAARRHAGRAVNELRQFLRTDRDHDTSLRTVLQDTVTSAADGVAVSVSVSGDRVPDDRDRLLADATAEAVRNAVRHGAPPIRVLAEVRADGSARVWVADEGPGFALDTVPDDRLGVRESIVGRLARAGGRASLDTTDGTEWELSLPPGPAEADHGSESPLRGT